MWAYPEISTLGGYTAYWRRHEPGRAALRIHRRIISYADLDLAADRMASWLGDRAHHDTLIGYLGKNSVDFYIAMFGTAKTRAGFLPFNWRLAPAELARHIADSKTSFAIVERESEGLWKEACAQLNRVPNTLFIDGGHSLEALIADTLPTLVEPPQESDVAVQIYTSGTTGEAKGVMLSHHNLNMSRLCEHLEPAYDWQQGDSFANGLPNFHLLHIGIGLQCLYNGVAIDIVRQFEPQAMLAAITQMRSTLLTLTPTMLQMLLDDPAALSADLSSLRTILYAGSPISATLLKRAMKSVPAKFMQFYGATEGGGITTLLRPDDHDIGNEQRLESCGRPLPLISLRIVDEHDEDVPDGHTGELLIRQPAVTKGYWRQPDRTAEVIQNGWYRSGDIARRDADGYYYIVDRAKDMIVTGGENVYSVEVESALLAHPAVASVAVIGVPHSRWGEAVHAVVVRSPHHTADEADLISFARLRLANYKVPKSIAFVDDLPLVSSGKVSKLRLREIYAK